MTPSAGTKRRSHLEAEELRRINPPEQDVCVTQLRLKESGSVFKCGDAASLKPPPVLSEQ